MQGGGNLLGLTFGAHGSGLQAFELSLLLYDVPFALYEAQDNVRFYWLQSL